MAEGAAAVPADVAPTTPAEASAQLALRIADKDWGAKVLSGDVKATREFGVLNEMVAKGDNVDAAMAGVVPANYIHTGEGWRPDEMVQTAGALRELGIGDDVIRSVLTNGKVTPTEHAAVSVLQAEKMSDRDWTKRLLARDLKAVREWTLMSIVLSSEIEGAA